MVRIGEVFWVASVKGADDAADSADQLNDSMGSVAGAAIGAASAQDDYADSASEANEQTERGSFVTGALNVAQSLLGSTLFFTSQSFSVASVAATAYTGAMSLATTATSGLAAVVTYLGGGLATATGYVSGFVSWLAAGSAGALAFGAAVGLAIGTLGVWILEVTGALDAVRNFGAWVGNVLPGWVRDGLLQMLSLAVGPLSVFGGFIVGFVQGGFDEAFRKAGQVVDVFIGSWDRQIGRIVSVAEDGWTMLKQGWTDFKNWIFGVVDGIVDKIMAIPDAAAEAADSIPRSDIAGEAGRQAGGAASWAAGGLSDAASGEVNLPSLDSGGLVRHDGIAQVHKGEAVIPESIVQGANRDGGSRTARVPAGGGDEETTYNIEIGDQTLDLSNVSRSTLRELAAMIDSEIGSSTGNLAGGR